MIENEWVERLSGHDGAAVADATPAELAAAAARAAEGKVGRDIIVLDVGDVLAITDFFVICHGGSDRQVKAIVDEVAAQLWIAYRLKPARVEGHGDLKWVLMDYGSFVVHAFDEESRAFYDLERLWKYSERLTWQA